MEFDEDVEQAIKNDVPAFFRAMARKGLEDYARQKGIERVDIATYEEAKAKYLSENK